MFEQNGSVELFVSYLFYLLDELRRRWIFTTQFTKLLLFNLVPESLLQGLTVFLTLRQLAHTHTMRGP